MQVFYSVFINYCIEGIFRGYKCSWFSRIRHEPRTFITVNLIFHACMLQKRRYSTKIKSAKTFLKAHPRKFIPSKYTRYTVVRCCLRQFVWIQYNQIINSIVHIGSTYNIACSYFPTHTQCSKFRKLFALFSNTTAKDDYTLVTYEVSGQLLPPPQ